MMPPFVVFPTNRIAHFVEVSLYLFYLAQQVNLINEIMKIQFWKREKIWKENYERQVLEEIINPIEKKLEEMENG